jgi:hypothetical protein
MDELFYDTQRMGDERIARPPVIITVGTPDPFDRAKLEKWMENILPNESVLKTFPAYRQLKEEDNDKLRNTTSETLNPGRQTDLLETSANEPDSLNAF